MILREAFQRPADRAGKSGPGLEISVVFTSVEHTKAAIRLAAGLADQLGARLRIVAVQSVPYPAPLGDSPVVSEWNEERLARIAWDCPVEARVDVFLCRERTATLLRELRKRSVVVVGGARRKWWPTVEQRLAKNLEKAGHEVIFATDPAGVAGRRARGDAPAVRGCL